MRKPANILLLAIVLGALSAALVYRHLRALRAEIEAARRPAVTVVVANETLSVGARIEPHQVRTAPWPVEIEPEGAIHDPASVVGNAVRTSIEKNQPVLKSQLAPPGAGLLPPLIAEGMRAMSVKVDSVTGVSGFITPSSRVDVLATGDPGGGGGQNLRGKLILQNVRVLASGKSVEQRDDKPVEVPTVTLLVSPEDAEKLTLATRTEPVRLTLRNFQDEAIVRTAGTSIRALFGEDGPLDGARDGASAHRPRYSVEVIRGPTVTRQTFYRP